MSGIKGIGGVFFKSPDPKQLSAWYQQHLGMPTAPDGSNLLRWRRHDDPEKAEVTVWAPFKQGTTYMDPSKAPFMVNYIVDDLDAMLEKLRAEGVDVDEKVEEYEYGKFGWVFDPDGNKIELWQPMGPGF